MIIPKTIKKTTFYILVVGLIAIICTPLFFLVSTSFMSSDETYIYPMPIIPAFSYQFELKEENGQPLFSIYRPQQDIYETVLQTGDLEQIKTYFAQQLSVIASDAKIQEQLDKLKDNKVVKFKMRKSLLYNYKTFFEIVEGAVPALWTSIKVAFLTIIISLTLGSMAGYAFARYIFKGKDFAKVSVLFVRMLPGVAMAVPMVIILARLGLYDNPLGLSLVYSVGSISLSSWITCSIFLSIPVELEEAAHVFGASKMKAFWKITFPLVLPGFAAASMYAFLGAWNETICALLLTKSNPTFAVVVYRLLSENVSEIALLAAGSLTLALPAVIFTLIIKKYINQMWGNASV